MSKRKKQQQPKPAVTFSQPVSPVSILAALAGAGVGAAPSWAETVEGVGVTGQAAFVRGIPSSVGCGCGREHDPDALVIAVPNAATRESSRVATGKPALRLLSISAIDGGKGNRQVVAFFDVEDAKRIVNALGEAIAAAEAV